MIEKGEETRVEGRDGARVEGRGGEGARVQRRGWEGGSFGLGE